MSNEELSEILNLRLKDVNPFELELGGITKQMDTFGNYLFLNVLHGLEDIVHIHDVLYENEFREFDMDLPYIPHVTLGKLPSSDLLDKAYDDVKHIDKTFRTMVDKICMEMIGENEESIIVIEKELGI